MEIKSTSVQFTIKEAYMQKNTGKVIVKITKEGSCKVNPAQEG